MTLLWLEGFDAYGYDEIIMAKKGWSVGSFSFLSNTFLRFGTGRNLENTNSGYPADLLFDPLGVGYSTIYFGVACMKNEAGLTTCQNSEPSIAFMSETGASQVGIYGTADFALIAKNGAYDTLGTSANGVWVDDVWFYLEVKVVIHDTAGVVIVRVNNKEVINETGLDTKNAGDYITKVRLRCINWDRDTKFDDLYIDDAKFHGDSRIFTFAPDANGSYSDFTPSAGSNYENVDEDTPDDDATYNEGNDEGDKDSYGITTSGINGPVKGVRLSNYIKKTGTLTVKTKELLKTGGSDFLGDEQFLSTEYLYGVKLWENNPDTSNPWTPSELDAAEFGVEVTAMSTTTTTT